MKKYLYLIILILGAYFTYRIYDFSTIIANFPIGYPADIPTYMAYLHFLVKYGFHEVVPNWFNGGIVLFELYGPGFFFFALPFYLLIKKVELTFFLVTLIIYCIVFFAIKKYIKNYTKAIVFFLFLLANPIAIGNFLRLGRVVELFGFALLFILILSLIYYKDKRIDKWFFIACLPVYTLLMITHPSLVLLYFVSLLPLTFFLITNKSHKLSILFCTFAGLIVSSFWWIDFLKASLSQEEMFTQIFTLELIRFDTTSYILTNLASVMIGISLFIAFCFYIGGISDGSRKKKEVLLFAPILLLNFLVLSRIIIFIPFLNIIFPDTYNIFFIFFTLFFFFKTNLILNKKIQAGLVGLALFLVIFSLIYTPLYPKHTSIDREAIEMYPFVEGGYIMIQDNYTSPHPLRQYAYGAIYYNLSTPFGSATWGTYNLEDKLKLNEITNLVRNQTCAELSSLLDQLLITSIIAFNGDCFILQKCDLIEKIKKTNACLYIYRRENA